MTDRPRLDPLEVIVIKQGEPRDINGFASPPGAIGRADNTGSANEPDGDAGTETNRETERTT